MRLLKEICGFLASAGIIVGFGWFLPVVDVLVGEYFAGFLLAAMVIPVARMMYRSHMAKVARLPEEIRQKKEKESQAWWKETSEATYSPSQALDLRNMTKINSIFDRH